MQTLVEHPPANPWFVRRLGARWVILFAILMILAPTIVAVLSAAGVADTPLWIPINKAGCYWNGLVPSGTLKPGQLASHSVPLPTSSGGVATLESVQVLGSAARAHVSFQVVREFPFGTGATYGSFVGAIPPSWRAVLQPISAARLTPEAPLPAGFPPSEREAERSRQSTSSGWQLVVNFSADPGEYAMTGFRMVFRQGWRKATCERTWNARYSVKA